MFRSVVVPLDGSEFGEHALPTAVALARRAGARVELAHVHEPLTMPDLRLPALEAEDRAARERARDYLDDVVARVTAAAPVAAVRTLLQGRPADALCEWLPTADADLVVMTTHGRGPLSRFWFGSVATELIQRLSVPVLLVRPQAGPPGPAAGPHFRRILIPLDGSPLAERVVPVAAAVAALTGAECRLLRVIPPVLTGGPLNPRRPATRRPAVEALEDEARAYLAAVAGRFPGPTPEAHVVADWPPAGAVLADADAHRADLIALATHGRGGLSRLLVGSVADKVARGASAPVLLYRPAAGGDA